jgi:hypothetical protein
MNIDFITDPELAPRPREEIEIVAFEVTPYPDGHRFRLDIRITPFAPIDRPSLEIEAVGEDDVPIGSVSVIDAMHQSLSLTMHIKQPDFLPGDYTFYAELYYDPATIQHRVSVKVRLPDDIPASP